MITDLQHSRSGLVNPNCMNLIGSGTIVHVPTFFEELQKLVAKGLAHAPERILISDRCHIITDLHVRVDGLEEQELGGRNIGTTKRKLTIQTSSAKIHVSIFHVLRTDIGVCRWCWPHLH